MKNVVLMAVLMPCFGLFGACGGGDADPPPANSAAAMREVAKAIYDEVEGEGDVQSYVEGVMTAFGMAPETEPDVLDARLMAKQPIFLGPQAIDLATAYAQGNYVTLDDFIAGAITAGVTRQDGGVLDKAYLDARFGELAGKTEYDAAEALPAFVLALSAERVARYGGGSDPLWGDGLLDPIQTTLLLHAVTRSAGAASKPAPAPAPPRHAGRSGGSILIGNFVKDRIAGQIEGVAVGWLEFPLGVDDLSQSALCASLLLFGHHLDIIAAPDIVWHQQLDVDPLPPYSTTVTANLVFMDDYWDNYAQTKGWVYTTAIGLAQCKLPRQGTIVGKPVTWGVSYELPGHGLYNFMQPMTDDDGKAVANWGTVAETTPIPQRNPAHLKIATGYVTIEAHDLVTGWGQLASAINLIRKTGTSAGGVLNVNYYTCLSSFAADACVDAYHVSIDFVEHNSGLPCGSGISEMSDHAEFNVARTGTGQDRVVDAIVNDTTIFSTPVPPPGSTYTISQDTPPEWFTFDAGAAHDDSFGFFDVSVTGNELSGGCSVTNGGEPVPFPGMTTPNGFSFTFDVADFVGGTQTVTDIGGQWVITITEP